MNKNATGSSVHRMEKKMVQLPPARITDDPSVHLAHIAHANDSNSDGASLRGMVVRRHDG